MDPTRLPDWDEVLRTEHLGRWIDGKPLVDDISIQVRRGEVLAVTGPSGSGKSSFLRLLNRLDEPTQGTVFFAGRDYRTIAPRELRRRVGLVSQSPFLFPGGVAANIRFGPEQRGKTLPAAAIQGLLEKVGLPGYADRDVANLSGGEAQRVALARALANEPHVLLLDEPTSALDATAKGEIEALLREILQTRDLTCVIVTHDSGQAARIADRVMILERGKLIRIGPAEEPAC